MTDRPFRVVFHLAFPLTLNHPWLHLDSLVLHASMLRVLGRAYYTLPTKQVVDVREIVTRIGRPPLAEWRGVPCGSISFFHPPLPCSTLAYFQRFEAEQFPGDRVNTAAGHFRNRMMYWTYRPARTVTFYGRGDTELCRDVLSALPAIGNDHRVGWGEVLRCDVEEQEEDWSLFKGGVAQRPIPMTLLLRASEVAQLAWRAPYWDRANIAWCASPGAEVEP
jgi:hypothetical protein